jgi:curved DNA-binding protein CbpA
VRLSQARLFALPRYLSTQALTRRIIPGSMDRDAIRSWLAVIDKLSYYELLGVESRAGLDDIRRAFYGFASTFHPDAHALRPVDERGAINTIFKRGTEAYRVLTDAGLRAHYDEARASKDAPTRMSITAPRSGPMSQRPVGPPPSLAAPTAAGGSAGRASGAIQGRLEDFVRQSRARPFAQQAEVLAKKNEFSKAKLQLKLAISMDPNNPALESYLKELEQRIAEAKLRPPQ